MGEMPHECLTNNTFNKLVVALNYEYLGDFNFFVVI